MKQSAHPNQQIERILAFHYTIAIQAPSFPQNADRVAAHHTQKPCLSCNQCCQTQDSILRTLKI